jgi:hypothetical protein
MPRILTIIAALLLVLTGSVAAQRSNAIYLPLVRNNPMPTATPTTEPTATPTATPTNAPMPTATATTGPACDPAYPTVCIPSPPPDLNCSDIPHRRFTVLAPDPHRFDTDGDGIGCES